MLVDYEVLRVIWWLLIGVLLIGFAVMDGFDLGVGMWLPWLGRSDMERRIIINSIGATWEGNQVWFILGGGALFAAWPLLYALSFSGFYLAMLVVLLALILRPVGFKYRSKLPETGWRAFWDWSLFIGGFVPSLIFGVAIGNVLQGVPFAIDESLRPLYSGTFIQLLNPFALCCGVLSVLMLAMHGGFYLQVKTADPIMQRAKTGARVCAALVFIVFSACGVWTYYGIDAYVLTSALAHDGPSNPLYKTVSMQTGAWFNNYRTYPITALVPLLSLLSALTAMIFASKPRFAFLCSGLCVATIIATVGTSMFPFIIPSVTNPNHSLIVWDSSSSQLTLFIMLIATVVFMPLILAYTAWVYRVLRGKITEESIHAEESAY